jgi:hypothetical protein
MPAVHTDLLVRLHVDKSGAVWYGDGGEPATNTFLDPWDFFENEARLEDLDNAKTIRLLGTRDNAPLITKLHERRLADTAFKFKRVELGSPGVVPPAWLRDDPISVMHHIWQLPASSNVAGQWHDMQTVDYATYSMMNTFTETAPGREVPDHTLKIAEYHPTWPAFTFIPTADKHAAARLICDIVDPRWYRHPRHPAQVEVYHEDVVVGHWKTVKFSGALPAADVRAMLERVEKLQKAVKIAREDANTVRVGERKMGDAILGYLFA